MSAPEHQPLTRDRHAALVDYLIRCAPRAWRVLFRPSFYLYDDRDTSEAGRLESHAQSMRVRFTFERDWDCALELIRNLISLDKTLCRMSVGIRIDGRDILGESI